MQKSLKSTKLSARFAILGAMIGDSLGSTMEFEKRANAQLLLRKHNEFADGLVGGGPFRLQPGQFTDDSEMILAVMSAIAQNGGIYNQELTAQSYHKWYLSNPFDIGNATRACVSKRNASEMIEAATLNNDKSLSNGFLMRLPGLVSLYYDKSQKELVDAIIEDVRLTHSHPETVHIAIIYGIILHKAINGSSAEEICTWIRGNCKHSELFHAIFDMVERGYIFFTYNNEEYTLDQIDSHIFGFVGFAIWMLVFSIKFKQSYRDSIIMTVGYGGDTDTNACIVGSVMAALYPDTVPKCWIGSVIGCGAVQRYQKYSLADPANWITLLP